MPFGDKSEDMIILFEAIYYIPDAKKFVEEYARVLRPGGKVLIATANKDLYDFNPSPHSYIYYGVVELNDLFARHGFETEFFGDTPIGVAVNAAKDTSTDKEIGCDVEYYAENNCGKEVAEEDCVW